MTVRRIMPYHESADFDATRAFYTGVLELAEGRFGGGYIGFGSGDMVYGLIRMRALEAAGVFRPVLNPDRLLIAELSHQGEIRQVAEPLWWRRQSDGGHAFREIREHEKVDARALIRLPGQPHGRQCQHETAHLGGLNKEKVRRSEGSGAPRFENPAPQGQEKADRYADPTVDAAHGVDVHGRMLTGLRGRGSEGSRVRGFGRVLLTPLLCNTKFFIIVPWCLVPQP